MTKIKVILWGIGAMGGGMAKDILTNKQGIQIVGAIGQNPIQFDRDLGDVLDLAPCGIKVSANPEEVLALEADVVLVATTSLAKDVFPQIKQILEAKKNVITIAEEMSAPHAQSPDLAAEIDQLAKMNGVTVLGTGVNPGFVLDTLILTLTGVCQRIDRVEAARVNDLSPFGPTVMQTQGVGTTVEEFQKGVDDGTIVGHIGFQESIYLIATALGWEIDQVEETREPIVTKVYRETPHVKVEPGMVAGCRHIARGYSKGKELISLEHPQQIHPHLEGNKTGDYITIHGTPTIKFSDEQEIPGGIGTMAIAVNMIPQVIAAKPGLKTMVDLPMPHGWMGCMAKNLQP